MFNSYQSGYDDLGYENLQPSLHCAPEMKRIIFSQNFVLILSRWNSPVIMLLQMIWDKSKLTSEGWEEILWHLEGFCKSFARVIRFYLTPWISLMDFCYKKSIEIGVNLALFIWQHSSRLWGGYLLVNYQKLVFHISNPSVDYSTFCMWSFSGVVRMKMSRRRMVLHCQTTILVQDRL